MPGHAPIVVEKLSDMFNNVYQMASPCAAGVSTTIKKKKKIHFLAIFDLLFDFRPGPER